jgi:hypothetical protein
MVTVSNPRIPFGAAARTLALWVRPVGPGFDRLTNNKIFVQYGTGNCNGKMFGIGRPGGSVMGWGGCADVNSTLSLPDEQWSFVAATYDGSTFSVWVGESVRRASASLATATTSAGGGRGTLVLGAEWRTVQEGVSHFFNGDMDDLMIFDRALSDGEIVALARR